MPPRTRETCAPKLRRWAVLWMCSLAIGCEPDEPLDEESMMAGRGGRSESNAGASAGGASGGMAAHDAGAGASGSAGGASAGGGSAAGGSASGGSASGASAGGTSAGGTSAGGTSAGGASAGADASGPRGDLDAGTDWTNADANVSGVMVGPPRRRDGGPPRWDPDAAGPILDPQSQAACLSLVDNICKRVVDCEASALEDFPEARRQLALESCRSTFLVNNNCNRAMHTASDFAACSEATKTATCTAVFLTDFGTSCVDKITFQR